MPHPKTYTEHLMTQRDVRKILVIELPDGGHAEVASDIEHIDALVAVFAKLRELDPTKAIFGAGWTYELDTMDRYCNSGGEVVVEHDAPVRFPSPLMRKMVPPSEDDEDDQTDS